MKKYIDSSFRKDKALFAVTQGATDGEQTIEISVQNYKTENFWTGEWHSVWSVKDSTLSGSLKIRCHYYEQGNMQFNLDKEFDSVAVKDISSAASILKTIKAEEDKVSLFFISLNF